MAVAAEALPGTLLVVELTTEALATEFVLDIFCQREKIKSESY